MDEHIRLRAVERLEGEPSQVARTNADATEGHLGHSLCREARDEAVAQVASSVDVDVAHRVVVVPARTERKWKCSEAPFIGLCGYCRLPSCVCDSRRLSSCLAAPMGATLWPGLASRRKPDCEEARLLAGLPEVLLPARSVKC